MLPVEVIGVTIICIKEESSRWAKRSCRSSVSIPAITIRTVLPPIQTPHCLRRRDGTAAVLAAGIAVIGCAGVRPEDGVGPAAGQLVVAPLLIRDESVSRRKRFRSARSSAAVW